MKKIFIYFISILICFNVWLPIGGKILLMGLGILVGGFTLLYSLTMAKKTKKIDLIVSFILSWFAFYAVYSYLFNKNIILPGYYSAQLCFPLLFLYFFNKEKILSPSFLVNVLNLILITLCLESLAEWIIINIFQERQFLREIFRFISAGDQEITLHRYVNVGRIMGLGATPQITGVIIGALALFLGILKKSGRYILVALIFPIIIGSQSGLFSVLIALIFAMIKPFLRFIKTFTIQKIILSFITVIFLGIICILVYSTIYNLNESLYSSISGQNTYFKTIPTHFKQYIETIEGSPLPLVNFLFGRGYAGRVIHKNLFPNYEFWDRSGWEVAWITFTTEFGIINIMVVLSLILFFIFSRKINLSTKVFLIVISLGMMHYYILRAPLIIYITGLIAVYTYKLNSLRATTNLQSSF